jgi:hypothetical protein
MKKFIYLVATLVIGLTSTSVASLSTVSADEIHNNQVAVVDEHSHLNAEASNVFESTLPTFLTQAKDTTNQKESRVGYRWRCQTCGYVSEWHALYSTASSRAYAHQQKYSGHTANVYAS